MAQNLDIQDGHQVKTRSETLYERTVLGFRNYWYPVCKAKEVGERRSKAVKLLGDLVVLLRRNGKVYALADECAHRGTQLSLGKCQFPGTNTITCRYHGWTYDVTNGMCLAVLGEGVDSKVVGKVKVRTYPVEERKGLLWIWMGKMAPVPLEEDVPSLMLRDDTVVRAFYRVHYGNWRAHADNPGAGHAQMLHRDSSWIMFQQFPAHNINTGSAPSPPEDDGGKWIYQSVRGIEWEVDWPGLGKWPRPRPWRRRSRIGKPVHGIRTFVSMRLPGLTRVPSYPHPGNLYHEWYVPVDEDHYIYFQVTSAWYGNPISRLWGATTYHLWEERAGIYNFNRQDVVMAAQTTNFMKRRGNINYLTSLTQPDSYTMAWREWCNKYARGEGTEATAAAEQKATPVASKSP